MLSVDGVYLLNSDVDDALHDRILDDIYAGNIFPPFRGPRLSDLVGKAIRQIISQQEPGIFSFKQAAQAPFNINIAASGQVRPCML